MSDVMMLKQIPLAACKRMQQLPTMLGPTVHGGKDTNHKSL